MNHLLVIIVTVHLVRTKTKDGTDEGKWSLEWNREFVVEKVPLFLKNANRAPVPKMAPFFVKIGTRICALFGSEWGGWACCNLCQDSVRLKSRHVQPSTPINIDSLRALLLFANEVMSVTSSIHAYTIAYKTIALTLPNEPQLHSNRAFRILKVLLMNLE